VQEKAVAALEEEAARVVGHPVLLSSPQQVCAVLYEELKLPPPSSRAGEVGAMNKFKAANQTHTTNEETLQRLTKLHPLPGIILEHRHVNKMLTGNTSLR
jgi:DNA polymerase-1